MSTISLLYQKEYAINDNVKIIIPTVGEILEDEDAYYTLVTLLTSMPYDLMVELDDSGIDYTEINEYELFLILFGSIRQMDTRLIFGDLDLSKFVFAENKQNGQPMLVDPENDIRIDRGIQGQIAATLRKIHHLEKNNRKPGNDEAKDYLLKRAREKARRRKNKKSFSQLESLIIAMVNTEQYKYDFQSTLGLTIYQFNESFRQIIKKVDYEHRMAGIYAGTVDPKGMRPDDLNWLIH